MRRVCGGCIGNFLVRTPKERPMVCLKKRRKPKALAAPIQKMSLSSATFVMIRSALSSSPGRAKP